MSVSVRIVLAAVVVAAMVILGFALGYFGVSKALAIAIGVVISLFICGALLRRMAGERPDQRP